MSIEEIAIAIVGLLMLAWPICRWVVRWIVELRRDRPRMDRWGYVFGMQRLPRESNRSFARRIRERQGVVRR